MRRRAIIASTLLILACAAWRPAQAATEIALGITSNTAFSLAHYVATEKKFYEAEDLKVDTIIAGAAVGVLQQLAAGSLNIAQAGSARQTALVPIDKNFVPVKLIFTCGTCGPKFKPFRVTIR